MLSFESLVLFEPWYYFILIVLKHPVTCNLGIHGVSNYDLIISFIKYTRTEISNN